MKCAFLLWVLSAVVASAENTILTAQKILDRMATTYRTCNCYEDSGVVESVSKSETKNRTNTTPFEIHFRRPSLFRVEFTPQYFPNVPGQRWVLWGDERQTRTYVEAAKSYWAVNSLDAAFAHAGAVSGGSALTVPHLLTDAIRIGSGLAELGNFILVREEELEGTDCYVVKADDPYPRRSCELWIGKNDFLLRKKREQKELANGTVSTVQEVHRSIRIDKDIPGTVFEFVPPSDAKVTDGAESAMENLMADMRRSSADSLVRGKATIAAFQLREFNRTSIIFVQCQPDGLAANPGIKASLTDLRQPGNAFETALNAVQTNGVLERIVVWVHPGSVATYRAIRAAVGNRPLTVQYEPFEDNTTVTDKGVRRIGFTALRPSPLPISAGKRPSYFECRNNQVFLIDDNNHAGPQGDSLEELDKPDGRFRSALSSLDKRSQYLTFLVRDDSLQVFRKARDIAEQQFACNTRWELISVDEPIKTDSVPKSR